MPSADLTFNTFPPLQTAHPHRSFLPAIPKSRGTSSTDHGCKKPRNKVSRTVSFMQSWSADDTQRYLPNMQRTGGAWPATLLSLQVLRHHPVHPSRLVSLNSPIHPAFTLISCIRQFDHMVVTQQEENLRRLQAPLHLHERRVRPTTSTFRVSNVDTGDQFMPLTCLLHCPLYYSSVDSLNKHSLHLFSESEPF